MNLVERLEITALKIMAAAGASMAISFPVWMNESAFTKGFIISGLIVTYTIIAIVLGVKKHG